MKTRKRNIDDVYIYVALLVIEQAIEDIKNYFYNKGTKLSRAEGFKSIHWIRNMEGSFPLIANCMALVNKDSLENVHQRCLKRINQLKKRAYEKQQFSKKIK